MGKVIDYLGMKTVQALQSQQKNALSETNYMDSLTADCCLRDYPESQISGDFSIYLSTKDEIDADESLSKSNLIGQLLFIAHHTRSDSSIFTSKLPRHVERP